MSQADFDDEYRKMLADKCKCAWCDASFGTLAELTEHLVNKCSVKPIGKTKDKTMKRYIIAVKGRIHNVCDTANGNRLVCSCPTSNDANCIAKALNASVPPFNGVDILGLTPEKREAWDKVRS